jgi:hypothetical protein
LVRFIRASSEHERLRQQCSAGYRNCVGPDRAADMGTPNEFRCNVCVRVGQEERGQSAAAPRVEPHGPSLPAGERRFEVCKGCACTPEECAGGVCNAIAGPDHQWIQITARERDAFYRQYYGRSYGYRYRGRLGFRRNPTAPLELELTLTDGETVTSETDWFGQLIPGNDIELIVRDHGPAAAQDPASPGEKGGGNG